MQSPPKRIIISKAIANRIFFLSGVIVLSEETHKVKFQDYPNRREQTFSLGFDKKNLETRELGNLTQHDADFMLFPSKQTLVHFPL